MWVKFANVPFAAIHPRLLHLNDADSPKFHMLKYVLSIKYYVFVCLYSYLFIHPFILNLSVVSDSPEALF